MAALSDAAFPRVVDLRQLRAEDLGPLLAEEVDEWREKLDWDFRGSAELVERFVAMHALTGYALVAANRVVGYAYYVCEERKGLIGDLFVMKRYRTEDAENLLLEPMMETLANAAWVKRIESQLMMLSRSFERALPMQEFVTVYPRTFMQVDLSRIESLPEQGRGSLLIYQAWNDRCQEDAARVIAEAYRGHIDSDINDQYRSSAGARRFLLNIVQYPGCGTFYQPASIVAADRSGRIHGICLGSLVQQDVGHITQICVTPEVRGCGVGYELLRRSLLELRRVGCRKVSLTVTTSNDKAIKLYESVGFRQSRTFAAYVWDRL
jgi:ribosomal protein S18 acetylase RimI-like enzyme